MSALACAIENLLRDMLEARVTVAANFECIVDIKHCPSRGGGAEMAAVMLKSTFTRT